MRRSAPKRHKTRHPQHEKYYATGSFMDEVRKASEDIYQGAKPKKGHKFYVTGPDSAKALSEIMGHKFETGVYVYDGDNWIKE